MSSSQSSLRSVGILTICSFIQLIFQVVIQQILAKRFGTSADTEAYQAALILPTVISSTLVGSLGSAFIPVYMKCRQDEGDQSARQFASQFGLFVFIVCGLFAVVCFFAARPLLTYQFPGFDESKIEKTVGVFHLLTWLTITNGMTGFLNALHHGEKRFRTPAFAGVIGVAMTISVVLLSPAKASVQTIAAGVLCGGIVCVVLQSKLFIQHFSLPGRFHSAIRRTLVLLAPLVAGAIFLNFGPIVDGFLASEKPASLALLGYANKIVNALLTLFSGSLAVVLFSTLSGQSAANDMKAFVSEVAHSWRLMAIVIIPVCLGLGYFSEPIIRDVYERGVFRPVDTKQVAWLLVLYLGMVVGGGYGALASKALFAIQDTRTPMLVSLFGAVFSILLKFYFGGPESFGVRGIAAVASFSYLLGAAVLVFEIRRRLGKAVFEGLFYSCLKSLVGTVVAIVVSAVIVNQDIPYSAIVAAPFGALSYFAVMLLFRDEFAMRLFRYVVPNR